MWNYGKLSTKFLVSSVKDIDTVGLFSFSQVLVEQLFRKFPLKFPAFTFSKPKGWSVSAWNTEAISAAFIMRGNHKNLTHTAGHH